MTKILGDLIYKIKEVIHKIGSDKYHTELLRGLNKSVRISNGEQWILWSKFSINVNYSHKNSNNDGEDESDEFTDTSHHL